MNFIEAERLLSTARSQRAGKPVANNTRLFPIDADTIAVRLHQTDVVTLHRDGRVTLDSGGWYTLTTKDRINMFLPSGTRLWQEQKRWYLSAHGWDRKTATPYFDGMTLDAEGNVLNGPSPEAWAAYERELAVYRKALTRYCGLVSRELRKGLPMPGPGDCWGCAMREVETGAEAFGVDHLRAHMDEGYVVPSLLVNALRESGYHDTGIYWHLGMKPDEDRMGGERWNNGPLVLRAVRRYMDRRIRPIPPTPEGGVREGYGHPAGNYAPGYLTPAR